MSFFKKRQYFFCLLVFIDCFLTVCWLCFIFVECGVEQTCCNSCWSFREQLSTVLSHYETFVSGTFGGPEFLLEIDKYCFSHTLKPQEVAFPSNPYGFLEMWIQAINRQLDLRKLSNEETLHHSLLYEA